MDGLFKAIFYFFLLKLPTPNYPAVMVCTFMSYLDPRGTRSVPENVMFTVVLLNLSSCGVNSHQSLTGYNLRCNFWYILHEEVHGLASSA